MKERIDRAEPARERSDEEERRTLELADDELRAIAGGVPVRPPRHIRWHGPTKPADVFPGTGPI